MSTEKELFADGQIMDVLLVMDKEKRTLSAVKGKTEDGDLQTVAATNKNKGKFFKFDKTKGIINNFIANLKSQFQNPTKFSFFKVPENKVVKVVDDFKKTQDESKLQTYKLVPVDEKEIKAGNEKKPENPQQQPKTEQANTEEKKVITETSEKSQEQSPQQPKPEEVTKPEEKQQQAPEQKPEVTPQQPIAETKPYYIDPVKIDWNEIEKIYGIKKADVEKAGDLEQLYKGNPSQNTYWYQSRIGNTVNEGECKLSFKKSLNEGEPPQLILHTYRNLEKELERGLNGNKLSEEVKEQIRQNGRADEAVMLVPYRGAKPEPFIVARDKDTNELCAFRCSSVRIPDTLKQLLDERQINDVKNGKVVNLTLNGKYGTYQREIKVDPFYKKVVYQAPPIVPKRTQEQRQQYNPEKNRSQENRNVVNNQQPNQHPGRYIKGTYVAGKIGDTVLTNKMFETLERGKSIKLQGVKDKKTGQIKDVYCFINVQKKET
ncbi:MAG: DUF3945 domain-containing protein [Tannerellaceae bacterium]|nr:DUF3945 domain-containing protein [Tannerellaceae bacterium]